MKRETVPGDSLFGLSLHGSDEDVRTLVEHGDGRFSICTIRKPQLSAGRTRVDAEVTFTMDDLIATATDAFTRNPSIQHDKFAGTKLAAGILMFAMAARMIRDTEQSA